MNDINNSNKDIYEESPHLKTEFYFTLIIICPDCNKEYTENESAIEQGAINKCHKCGFTWIHENIKSEWGLHENR